MHDFCTHIIRILAPLKYGSPSIAFTIIGLTSYWFLITLVVGLSAHFLLMFNNTLVHSLAISLTRRQARRLHSRLNLITLLFWLAVTIFIWVTYLYCTWLLGGTITLASSTILSLICLLGWCKLASLPENPTANS